MKNKVFGSQPCPRCFQNPEMYENGKCKCPCHKKGETRIWKTPLGKFISISDPTARELRILIASGCKPFVSEKEFIKLSKKKGK